jgi:hypothetical protein
MKARQLLTLSMVIAMIGSSCHKSPVHQPDIPAPLPLVKLKDINVRTLPSPYYHFEYNDTGNITIAGFQGGLRIYDVDYSGKNIASMQNIADPLNKVRLDYEYMNGDLLALKIKDKNGVVFRHCILSFSSAHQLKQVDWDIADGNVGFYQEQTVTFSYYPDGNVMEIKTHNYAVGSQTEATYIDKFEDYDDKVNADGFSLLHTNGHELILMPGLRFQINNPRHAIRTGDGINYEIGYSYSYDSKGRTTVKTGDLKFTNGPNAGQHLETQSTFSYYD